MSTVEALSIKNINSELPISLRGSLADNYQNLIERGMSEEAKRLLDNLLSSNDTGLLRYPEGNYIVVGLQSERGKYFPDW